MNAASVRNEPANGRAAILVVEDEVLVRIVLADELRAHGYTVIEAANADEALSVLHSSVHVDLLLTDVQMPGSLNGIGLARTVRAEYPAVKVLVASGRMPEMDTRAPVDGFFAKPYDFQTLIAHIRSLLPQEP